MAFTLLSQEDRLVGGHRFHIRRILLGQRTVHLIAHYKPGAPDPAGNHIVHSAQEVEPFIAHHLAIFAVTGDCSGLLAVKIAPGGKSHYSHFESKRTNCGITFEPPRVTRVGDFGDRPPRATCERCQKTRY